MATVRHDSTLAFLSLMGPAIMARHGSDHRCPGEWSTVELLQRAVRLPAASGYEVPAQDLSIRLNHLPAGPRSGFVLSTGATG